MTGWVGVNAVSDGLVLSLEQGGAELQHGGLSIVEVLDQDPMRICCRIVEVFQSGA